MRGAGQMCVMGALVRRIFRLVSKALAHVAGRTAVCWGSIHNALLLRAFAGSLTAAV